MRSLILIALISGLLSVAGQPQPAVYGPPVDLPETRLSGFWIHGSDSLWSQVDSLSRMGLPNSALALVDQIYRRAKENGDDSELVKAILYRTGLNASFQENFPLPAIRDVTAELESARRPVIQILRSILGELYWSYYQRNEYRLHDRSTLGTTESDDPQTWDARRLTYEIILQYRLSLSDAAELKRIPLERFRSVIEPVLPDTGQPDSITRVHPTLFDFLAYRALQFFTQTSFPLSLSVSSFHLDTSAFFAPAAEFVNYPLQPEGIRSHGGDGAYSQAGTDTLSLAWYATRIYQEVIRFHLTGKNPEVLIDWDLQRLAFIRTSSTLPGKDSLFLDALYRLETDFSFSPASANISFALAQALVSEGAGYDPLLSEAHRWDLKEAIDLCRKAATRFPDSRGGKNCLALADQIETPSLSISADYALIPGQAVPASVAFRNVPALYFRLVRAHPEQYGSDLSGQRSEDVFTYLNSLELVTEWQVSFPVSGDYQQHRTEFAIPPIPAGFYLLFASADSLFRNHSLPFTYQAIWSTRISYITRRNEAGGTDLYLMDRESGFPLKGLRVEAFFKTYDNRSRQYIFSKAGEYLSDDAGFLTILSSAGRGAHSGLILHIHDQDEWLITQPIYIYPVIDRPERTTEQTRFYTDRAIYRPGQPIYFKGIVLTRTGDSTSLKCNKKTTVTFTNVNGQKVSEQTFVTDEWGAFNGSFTAPSGVLLGTMRIFNESGSVSIDVEEYKRPTFGVTFQSVKGNYMLGQQVTVTGLAEGYAGNAIGNATVVYRVVRLAHYPYRYGRWAIPFPPSPETEVTSGITGTAPDGSFDLVFEAVPDGSIPSDLLPVFTFQIRAEVTDVNGETRQGQETLSVGYVSLLLDIDLPEKVNLKGPCRYQLATRNLNGEKTPALVEVTLEKLLGPERAFRNRLWSRPDTQILSRKDFYSLFPHDIYNNDDDPATWPVEKELSKQVMNTASDTILSLNDLRSGIRDPGSYKLTLTATDPFGRKVETVRCFTAFDPESKRIPGTAFSWFVPLKSLGEPGETASFLIGTSEKEVRVIQEIRVKDRLVSREWITLRNQQRLVEIPITESYRGNVAVGFLFVKDNRVYQNSQVVTVPFTDKALDIKIETFRDKIKPGQHEQWKIRITPAGGAGAAASLVATMYDRSLDLFRSNRWSFDLYREYFYGTPWDVNDDFRTTGGAWYRSSSRSGFISQEYSRLNWFGMQPLGYGYYRDFMRKGAAEASDYKSLPEAELHVAGMEPPPPPPLDEPTGVPPPQAGADSLTGSTPRPAIPLRKEFRETAFFYPSLITDNTGTLFLTFTAPDALTSWKVLGLAYTKALDWGLITRELVTHKELMVFPNAPRYVRQGDTLVLITRIVNLSEREITGEATLDLTEAITGQPMNGLIRDTGNGTGDHSVANGRSFTIPAGQSVSLSWTLAIPVSRFLNLLQYTVKAQAGEFSDGETNTLPVLTNRMLVTESLPLPVKGTGPVDFRFDKLLRSGKEKSLNTYRLTLEFASNPAWYAVQALPALDDMTYRNSEQIFGAFYANALGSFIAGSSPTIRQVFESWKSLSPDALLSNLERNEGLKSALLQETPWVVEGLAETENRRRLGLFFDANNLSQNLSDQLTRLQKMQYPSGGWPWFEGMQENRIISLSILTGLGRLDLLGVRIPREESRISQMAGKALDYLGKELVREHQQLLRTRPGHVNENQLNPFVVKYLYARSLFSPARKPFREGEQDPGSRPSLPDELTQALDYYTAQAKKFWLRMDLLSQGMIALALHRMEEQEVPARIMHSLSERALHSPELGMYWAVGHGYQWYQAPVEIQALLIEAFEEVLHDTASVEEMKTWLLKQKQTQMWRTRQATVDACFALLLRGTDLLTGDPGVVIRLGDTTFDPARERDVQQEAGTGYFRVSWTGDAVKPEMGNLSITKASGGTAWGGIYWQYFANLDEITPHETPLTVTKEIFLETNSASGPVLMKIPDPRSGNSDPLSLQTGDKLIVRLVVTADRTMEFVHLKDMRAAGLEPLYGAVASTGTPGGHPDHYGTVDPLSGYRYRDGLGYYQSTTDEATNFFFDLLPKGTWLFEYPLVVNNAGDFSSGIATIQCLYAPAFSAHSEGGRIEAGN